MASSVIEDRLADWLEQVSVGLTGEEIKAYRSAVLEIAKNLDADQAFDLVRCGFAVGDDTSREWILSAIREQDGTYSGSNGDALVPVVAAAATIEILANSRHKLNTRFMLLTRAAQLNGLSPTIPEIIDTLGTALVANTTSRRQRPGRSKSIAKTAETAISKGAKWDPATPQQWQQLADELEAHKNALLEVSKTASSAISDLRQVIKHQDEELNLLWWSYGGRSLTEDKNWSEVEPLEKRIVLAVKELRGLTNSVPASPSAPAILTRAFDAPKEATLTIGEVAKELIVAGLKFEEVGHDRLTPISAAVREMQRVGEADDTWKTVVSRTLSIDANRHWTPSAIGEQLLLELDLDALV